MSKRAASVRTMIEALGVTPQEAGTVRRIWCNLTREELLAQYEAAATVQRQSYNDHPTIHLRRIAIASVLNKEFHGVEFLGWYRRTEARVYYLNAGDPYAATLIFQGDNLRVACWGDLVERNAIKETL
jgi:hypothetical protein